MELKEALRVASERAPLCIAHRLFDSPNFPLGYVDWLSVRRNRSDRVGVNKHSAEILKRGGLAVGCAERAQAGELLLFML